MPLPSTANGEIVSSLPSHLAAKSSAYIQVRKTGWHTELVGPIPDQTGRTRNDALLNGGLASVRRLLEEGP